MKNPMLCTYACEGCHAFRIDEAGRQALRDQLHSGAKRLQLTCPFPNPSSPSYFSIMLYVSIPYKKS
jgi:hypothetical protein